MLRCKGGLFLYLGGGTGGGLSTDKEASMSPSPTATSSMEAWKAGLSQPSTSSPGLADRRRFPPRFCLPGSFINLPASQFTGKNSNIYNWKRTKKGIVHKESTRGRLCLTSNFRGCSLSDYSVHCVNLFYCEAYTVTLASSPCSQLYQLTHTKSLK
jgi:hypothetical protein